MTRILLLLLGAAFLSACGQKGALYLPPPEGETAHAVPKAPKTPQPAQPTPEESLSPEENRLLSPETAPADSPAPEDGGASPPEIQPLVNP
jgi:predicted small lipoprotein YifL